METGLTLENRVFTKFETKSFHPSIKNCVRVYPHVHNLDGFFVAKLKKLKDGEKNKESEKIKQPKRSKVISKPKKKSS